MSHRTEGAGMLAKEHFAQPGPGRLGVVAARAGVGKSICLICLALDELIQGRQVFHVSLETPVAHVRAAYDAALDALRAGDTASIPDTLRFEVEQRRVIHSYLGGSFTPSKLEKALGFLAEHMDFCPSSIVIDGFSFVSSTESDAASLRGIAEQANVEVWMSALTSRDEGVDEQSGLPLSLAPFAAHLEVVLSLVPEGDEIILQALREGGRVERRSLPVVLDSNTRLLKTSQL